MDVNKVILLGRLTKDPIAKAMPSGQEISLLSLATNYQWRDQKTKERQERVEFHSAIAWGNIAKVANKYLAKGAQVYLEGRLKTRDWKDKAGIKHYKTEVVISEMNMLGGSKKQGNKQQEDLSPESITIEEVPIEE
ncbi:MAG: single-stranded DNA-binding protein [Candidatus Komeilibacteria bacterium]|nr:single-stranded DNA-binding protein [Candidatus Komeilibacteria bacterium]